MAFSTGAVSTELPPRYRPSAYAPPDPLEAVHILDLLELTGSQIKAGQALALHQSTVCRSVKMLSEQFRLQSQRGARVCRYGSNDSLHYLRLSYRAHRLMEGQLRVATDPLHQSLLSEIGNVQTVPARFRAAEDWAQLVALGLIDGAIVPSYAQGHRRPWSHRPTGLGWCRCPWGGLPSSWLAPPVANRGCCCPSAARHPNSIKCWSGMGMRWRSNLPPARKGPPG